MKRKEASGKYQFSQKNPEVLKNVFLEMVIFLCNLSGFHFSKEKSQSFVKGVFHSYAIKWKSLRSSLKSGLIKMFYIVYALVLKNLKQMSDCIFTCNGFLSTSATAWHSVFNLTLFRLASQKQLMKHKNSEFDLKMILSSQFTGNFTPTTHLRKCFPVSLIYWGLPHISVLVAIRKPLTLF